ncbi:hypothetical protein QEN19_002217 [Hanseniaspora menglaensis]
MKAYIIERQSANVIETTDSIELNESGNSIFIGASSDGVLEAFSFGEPRTSNLFSIISNGFEKFCHFKETMKLDRTPVGHIQVLKPVEVKPNSYEFDVFLASKFHVYKLVVNLDMNETPNAKLNLVDFTSLFKSSNEIKEIISMNICANSFFLMYKGTFNDFYIRTCEIKIRGVSYVELFEDSIRYVNDFCLKQDFDCSHEDLRNKPCYLILGAVSKNEKPRYLTVSYASGHVFLYFVNYSIKKPAFKLKSSWIDKGVVYTDIAYKFNNSKAPLGFPVLNFKSFGNKPFLKLEFLREKKKAIYLGLDKGSANDIHLKIAKFGPLTYKTKEGKASVMFGVDTNDKIHIRHQTATKIEKIDNHSINDACWNCNGQSIFLPTTKKKVLLFKFNPALENTFLSEPYFTQLPKESEFSKKFVKIQYHPHAVLSYNSVKEKYGIQKPENSSTQFNIKDGDENSLSLIEQSNNLLLNETQEISEQTSNNSAILLSNAVTANGTIKYNNDLQEEDVITNHNRAINSRDCDKNLSDKIIFDSPINSTLNNYEQTNETKKLINDKESLSINKSATIVKYDEKNVDEQLNKLPSRFESDYEQPNKRTQELLESSITGSQLPGLKNSDSNSKTNNLNFSEKSAHVDTLATRNSKISDLLEKEPLSDTNSISLSAIAPKQDNKNFNTDPLLNTTYNNFHNDEKQKIYLSDLKSNNRFENKSSIIEEEILRTQKKEKLITRKPFIEDTISTQENKNEIIKQQMQNWNEHNPVVPIRENDDIATDSNIDRKQENLVFGIANPSANAIIQQKQESSIGDENIRIISKASNIQPNFFEKTNENNINKKVKFLDVVDDQRKKSSTTLKIESNDCSSELSKFKLNKFENGSLKKTETSSKQAQTAQNNEFVGQLTKNINNVNSSVKPKETSLTSDKMNDFLDAINKNSAVEKLTDTSNEKLDSISYTSLVPSTKASNIIEANETINSIVTNTSKTQDIPIKEAVNAISTLERNVVNPTTTIKLHQPSYIVPKDLKRKIKEVDPLASQVVLKKQKKDLDHMEFFDKLMINPIVAFSKIRISIPKTRSAFEIKVLNKYKVEVVNGNGSEQLPTKISVVSINEDSSKTFNSDEVIKPLYEHSQFFAKNVSLSTGTSSFFAFCSENGIISVCSPITGLRLEQPLVVGVPISFLESSGNFLVCLTTIGDIYCWNMKEKRLSYPVASIYPILSPALRVSNDILSRAENITGVSVTNGGIAIVTLSNGDAFLYDKMMQSWSLINDSWWAYSSRYWDASNNKAGLFSNDSKIDKYRSEGDSAMKMLEYKTNEELKRKGVTKLMQNFAKTMLLKEGFENLEQSVSVSHLVNKLFVYMKFEEYENYKETLITLCSTLAEFDLMDKLNEIFEFLFGELGQDEKIGSLSKHDLLKTVVAVVHQIGTQECKRLARMYANELNII